MNFIFISPHFPQSYWQFCRALKNNGVNVLGIADAPYDQLPECVKNSVNEYYRVDNMEDYDQVYKAVAYYTWKYGRIDWVESNNEYWLEMDSRIRTDFNINSGIKQDSIAFIKEKSEMKKIYLKGKIPTARQIVGGKGLEEVLAFTAVTGYPIIAKPDKGVGASGTFKLHSDDELKAFYAEHPDNYQNYVIEEFISAEMIDSYDAIINSKGEPVFENMTCWPPSIMDIVNKKLDLYYYVAPSMPEKLRKLGRKTVKAFKMTNRFVHLEFFRLDVDKPGLGKKGDYVALEVNMRPPGGYTPDMMDWAHSTDVYQAWADMVAFDENRTGQGEQYYCAYASRRDIYSYVHTHQEILERYGDSLVQVDRMPDILSAAMGNDLYTAKLRTEEEKDEFIAFVHEKRS